MTWRGVKPEWWWPLGMGEQPLYGLELEQASDGRMDAATGLVSGQLDWVRESDEFGRSFQVRGQRQGRFSCAAPM